MLSRLVLAALLASSTAQATPNYWPQMAKADLDFVYRTLQENHPGAIDKENPDFRQSMERGHALASASAAKAQSLADMKRVLARYLAGFADGHLAVRFNQQASDVKWPGIVMGRIGKRYLVSGLAQTWPAPLPALNAELISCDGRTPDTMMNEDILPALFNLTSLDSVKTKHMFHFFLDDDLAPHQYARCVFVQEGERKEFALTWRQATQVSFEQHWAAATPNADARSSITQVAPASYWVHLPNFKPDAAAEAELKNLIGEMPSLRAADLVVFDLRGNGGGNSQWGYDVLASLYGKPFMEYRRVLQDNKAYAEWRVSAANLKYLDDALATQVRQFGAGSDMVAEIGALAARMRAALTSGQPFVRQDDGAARPAVARTGPAPLSKAHAILVTDSNCASSCLNGADAVLSLPGARHFGRTTGADTVYMDVRKVQLPSGLGRLVLAMKVDRAGLRANNQPWEPSHHYDGQIGDTEKLRAWVMKNAR